MNFAKKATIFALLLTAGSLALQAQDRMLTFTLTKDAYFGPALLPSGNYRLQLISDSTPRVIVSSVGSKTTTAIVAVSRREFNTACKASTITLRGAEDSMAMSSVCVADTDVTYYFPIRKIDRVRQVAKEQDLAGIR